MKEMQSASRDRYAQGPRAGAIALNALDQFVDALSK